MSETAPDDAPRPGRPLDASLGERVLDATRRSLSEAGWNGTTVRGIAERSGVSRPAIARRWPSKAHLVLDAILGPTPDLAPFDGADRDAWVRAVVDGSFELFERPDVVAAVPGLLSELGTRPDVRDTLWASFSGPASALLVGTEDDPSDAARSVDARALIALAAGAALFTSLVVGSDQADVAARVRSLTLELLDASTSRTQPTSDRDD